VPSSSYFVIAKSFMVFFFGRNACVKARDKLGSNIIKVKNKTKL
jgi:hypothetical protein